MPTRDEKLARQFEGGPRGIVIARYQHIGSLAALKTFEHMVDNDVSPDDFFSAADLFAMTSIGTAYHTFAQPKSKHVMYRRVKIPRLVDSETEQRVTHEELVRKTQTGLAQAADLAVMIENMVQERQPVDRANEWLGRSLATTGMDLAALEADLTSLRLDEEDMQWESWQAAQGAYLRTIELSGKIGARPTVAQLADDQSPLRRYLHDNKESVSQMVYRTLLEQIEAASETKRSE